DEVDRVYRVINDIIEDYAAPGDPLRDLAAIADLRLFVSTTPDRLLAQAVNDVRFEGREVTREVMFSRVSPRANGPEMPTRLRQPTPSFSVCLVKPPRLPSMRSTRRTGWSGFTRCSATRRACPTGLTIGSSISRCPQTQSA